MAAIQLFWHSQEFEMAMMPEKVMHEIRQKTFEVLDDEEYMACGRVEARRIMNNLVAHPQIGNRIAEYVGRPHVRTYIKDAILNRYTKEKSRPPADWAPILSEVFGADCELIGKAGLVQVFRSLSGRLIVSTSGRLLKWETGLRKLLEYRAQHEAALQNEKEPIGCCLLLMSGGAQQNQADRKLLARALSLVDVEVVIL